MTKSSSMSHSNLSQRNSQPRSIVQNKHSQSVTKISKQNPQHPPRFNHITVH